VSNGTITIRRDGTHETFSGPILSILPYSPQLKWDGGPAPVDNGAFVVHTDADMTAVLIAAMSGKFDAWFSLGELLWDARAEVVAREGDGFILRPLVDEP
jgi:hypothetical protein